MVEAKPLTMKDVIDHYPDRRLDALSLSFDEFKRTVVFFDIMGKTCSFWAGDKLLGIGGVFHLNKGCGQVWLSMSDEVKKHAKGFTVCGIKMLDEHNKIFHRIQTDMPAKNISWIRWMKKLGFKQETKMTCYYGDKSDAVLLVRIRA